MTARSTLACLALAAALLASAARGEEKTDKEDRKVFVSVAAGFRIEQPDAGWAFEEKGDPANGKYVLALYPKNRKGLVQVTVRASFQTAASGTPASLRDQVLAWSEGKPAYAHQEKITLAVAGRDAAALSIEQTVSGQTFRVHQAYLVEKGCAFTVGYHAPADRFASRLPAFQRILETFRFVEPDPDTRKQRKRLELASRCGQDLPWASSWKEASERAGRERRLILVLVREAGGFETANAFLTVSLMEPDLYDLVRHRFVPLRFRKGMGAPFESHDVYGLGPSTFGTSLLVATPGGEVIGDTFSYEPASLHDLLVRTLANHRDLCGIDPPDGLGGADLATWCLERGALERASGLLQHPGSAREHLLKADLLRRLRTGPEALRELDRAQSAADGTMDAEVDLRRAVVLIRMGKTAEAYSHLTRLLHRFPEHARVPEALFRLGTCAFHRASALAAGRVWTRLVDEHPGSRWARRASAILVGPAFALGIGRSASWPAPEVLALLAPRAFETLPVEKAGQAEREALGYLLENQRPDGSWICSSEVSASTQRVPHDFTVAVTSVAGLSLLPYRENARALRAVHLAVGYVLQAEAIERAVGRKTHFMDYGVWRKAYALQFLCAAVEAGIAEKQEMEAPLARLVSDLEGLRKPGGGWSYYVARRIDEIHEPSEQTISFCTAAALLALREAREIGVVVPAATVDVPLSCLERMKNPDGTFAYMLFHGQKDAPRKPNLEGSAGRGPLCALTLERWGRGDLDAIRQALALFADHRDRYMREKGKTLMHAGLGGQGSHYLLFDYAHAAIALSALPEVERMAFRGILLDTVLDARRKDGSYVDNPMIGPHLGTAMALVALRHLRGGG